MRHLRPIATAGALALLAACNLDTGPNVPDPIDPVKDTYASSLNVDMSKMTKTASGLYYRDLDLPTSGVAAVKGDSVQVHYTLWLTNGTKVESSEGGDPLAFLTGQNPPRVIPGFEEGVLGMRPNGRRQLVIPPSLAWGARGQPPVQPNANVVFEIKYLGKL
jgi:FKBP-type peptidyl-prolyl cis-trans isomerase